MLQEIFVLQEVSHLISIAGDDEESKVLKNYYDSRNLSLLLLLIKIMYYKK